MTVAYWIAVAASIVLGFVLALLAGYLYRRWFKK